MMSPSTFGGSSAGPTRFGWRGEIAFLVGSSMGNFNEERDRDPQLPTGEAAPPPSPGDAKPLSQGVFPNLDRVSRESLRKGTFSRRRVIRAAIGFLIVVIVIVGIVWYTWPVR